jgi:predicted phosphodiesterase
MIYKKSDSKSIQEKEQLAEFDRLVASGVGKKKACELIGVSKGTPANLRKRLGGVSVVRNILVIGDLHEPFCLDNYLEFCKQQYKKYKCNKVIFAGDMIDNHFSSYHDTDPDGMGGGYELELAIKRLKPWYKEFPIADVCIGNHDKLPRRKAFSGGVPKAWMREYKDVLGVPKWTFKAEFVYDGVVYTHGTNKARAKAKNDLTSIVQGHLHSDFYIDYFVGRNYAIFAMQVGCGVDREAYALAYAKNFPKQAIGCGVVLDNGTRPILCLAKLSNNKIIV